MRKLNKILLVDDDAITNFLNELLIKEMGITHELIIANNGLEALENFSDQSQDRFCPELILLDINMPIMNGFEFLKKFGELDFENKESVIIIMLSTSLNPRDSEKAKELNVKDYLSKPLTKEGITGVLEKYFQ